MTTATRKAPAAPRSQPTKVPAKAPAAKLPAKRTTGAKVAGSSATPPKSVPAPKAPAAAKKSPASKAVPASPQVKPAARRGAAATPAKASTPAKPAPKAPAKIVAPLAEYQADVERNELGLVPGSLIDIAAQAMVAGGEDRRSILESLRAADRQDKRLSRNGNERNWSVAMTTALNHLASRGYKVEAHWKMVPPVAGAKPATSPAPAAKRAPKASAPAPAAKAAPAKRAPAKTVASTSPAPIAKADGLTTGSKRATGTRKSNAASVKEADTAPSNVVELKQPAKSTPAARKPRATAVAK